MKKCPMCAEEIQDEAIKCKHCGEMISKPKTTVIIAKVCPKCNKEYDATWSVCLTCNSPLEFKTIERGALDNTPQCVAPKMLPSNVLMPGEKVYIEARPSFQYVSGWWALVLIFGLFVLAGSVSIGILIIMFSILGITLQILSWKSIVYAMTDKRVLALQGILSRECRQCPLSKIQNFEYKKYPFSTRGYIFFDTAGSGTKEVIWKYINYVEDVYHKVSAIIHK